MAFNPPHVRALAEAGWHGAGTDDGDGLHPALCPASGPRRLAAAAFDVAFGGLAGFLTSTVCFLGAMAFLPTDFDGPPNRVALGDWYLIIFFALGALLYGLPEAFGIGTVGKYVFALELAAPRDGPRPWRRYVRRWCFKIAPLICVMVVGISGAVHTRLVGMDAFRDAGWAPGREVAAAFAAPLVVCFVAFTWCFSAGRRSLYDRSARVMVVHAAFEVGASQEPTTAPRIGPPPAQPFAS